MAKEALELHLYGMEEEGAAIPRWLNDAAESKKVNFSQLLQSALKNYLGIQDYKV